MVEDSHFHKGLRKRLVAALAKQGITERVLTAFEKIPRHFFVDSFSPYDAYEDRALPIGDGQTISRPSTVAWQTMWLDAHAGDKILEVGTGSAYQAMILAAMGANVYTIERHRNLFVRAKAHTLNRTFKSVRYFYGDGFVGLPTYAPFDKIIITAGAREVPENLLVQLKADGIMLVPVGEGDTQKMLRIKKRADGTCERESLGDFSFVPMLHAKARPNETSGLNTRF